MSAPRRIVLVGFMGAGKSTVGRILAERLGWRFIDLDEHIERTSGLTVADLFAERGEPAFRALEEEATRELAGTGDVVLAPGGGWILRPGLLDLLRTGSLVVWLRVTPATAVERCRAAGATRPLLAVEDPVAQAAILLHQREPYYERADVAIDTEGASADDVARAILDHLRS